MQMTCDCNVCQCFSSALEVEMAKMEKEGSTSRFPTGLLPQSGLACCVFFAFLALVLLQDS